MARSVSGGGRRKKAWQPSRRQLQIARQQQRGYVSQGRAVRRVAPTQRAIGVARPSIAPVRARQIVQRQRSVAAQQRQAAQRQRNARLYRNARIQQQAFEREARVARRAARRSGPPTPPIASLERIRARNAFHRAFPQAKLSTSARLPTQQLRARARLGPTTELKLGAGSTPVMKVLDVAARPAYASAGAAQAAIKGRSIPRAIGRSLTGKQRTLYGDVLRDLGVHNKTLAGVGGFIGDVALDPTTYLTFGVSSVAKQSAIKSGAHAAEVAARRSLKDSAAKIAEGTMTKGEAKRLAKQKAVAANRAEQERALKQAARHEHRQGLTVGVAGSRTARRVQQKVAPRKPTRRAAAPLVRATGQGARAGRAVARPIARNERVRRAGWKVREAGSQLAAPIRPAGVSRAEFKTIKSLRRERRAVEEKGQREATTLANKLAKHPAYKKLDPVKRRLVHDALEANRLTAIKDDSLRVLARQIRDQFRGEERVGRRAGTLAGRVGERSRTREEVESFGARAKPRSAEPLRPELKKAQADFEKAKVKLREAKTPQARAGARRTLVRTSQRVTNLRGQIRARESAAKRFESQSAGVRASRRTRFEKQARGYVPRRPVKEAEPVSATQFAVQRLEAVKAPPRSESGGVVKPQAASAKRRTYTARLSHLREQNPRVAAKFEELNPQIVQGYGATMRKAAARANQNQAIFREFGSDLKQHGTMTKGDVAELARQGTHAVYRLRRGELEELGPADWQEINLASRGRATRSAAQYAVIRRDLPERVYGRSPKGPEIEALKAFDRAQGVWKSVALATPGYLTRNFVGDLWNAYTDESAFRLVRNAVKGGKLLSELGRLDKAGRKLSGELPESLREIKLTPEQIESVAELLGKKPEELALKNGKANAAQLAMLAEKVGAIRQGRYLELVQEQPKGKLGRGTSPFRKAAQRVEDSVRIATFLGGLERGLKPREAAERVSKLHFDYGDLSEVEKRVARRLLPFYTFSARNIPLQARAFVRSPGKYAHIETAREEGRRATGLPEGYEKGLDPFEIRQLGIPVRLGGQVSTVSFASPFVDLNDVANVALHPNRLPTVAIQKFGEQLGPWKAAPELVYNYSLFYRDQIEKEGRMKTLAVAPQWAVKAGSISPQFAKRVGLTKQVNQQSGKDVWMWPRKVDYAARQLPGPLRAIGSAPGLGIPEGTKSARGFGPIAEAVAVLGPRAKPFDPRQARLNVLYEKQTKLDDRMTTLRKTRGRNGELVNATNPTREYARLQREKAAAQREIDRLNRTSGRAYYKGRKLKQAAPSSGDGWGTSGGW